MKGGGEKEVLESQGTRNISLVSRRAARGPAAFPQEKWLQDPFEQMGSLATSKEIPVPEIEFGLSRDLPGPQVHVNEEKG